MIVPSYIVELINRQRRKIVSGLRWQYQYEKSKRETLGKTREDRMRIIIYKGTARQILALLKKKRSMN